MAISMLKIRRPLGRLIFNMGIAIPGKTVFLIETAPSIPSRLAANMKDHPVPFVPVYSDGARCVGLSKLGVVSYYSNSNVIKTH